MGISKQCIYATHPEPPPPNPTNSHPPIPIQNIFPPTLTTTFSPKILHPPKIMPHNCQIKNVKFTGQKAQQFFNYFSKEFFDFWIFQLCSIFANFKNLWAILENLSCKTKNLNFVIRKISLTKNLVNLKPLMSFSMEHVELTGQLFG